jgi:hypothetical protein
LPPTEITGAIALIAIILALTSPTAADRGSVDTYAPGAMPDFSIDLSPTSVSVIEGSSATATITVTSLYGFTSAVTLSASWVGTPPPNVYLDYPGFQIDNPSVTPPPDGTARTTLTVTPASGVYAGIFTLSVTGTSGVLSHDMFLEVKYVSATTAHSRATRHITMTPMTATYVAASEELPTTSLFAVEPLIILGLTFIVAATVAAFYLRKRRK